jgi:hypothetical protein
MWRSDRQAAKDFNLALPPRYDDPRYLAKLTPGGRSCQAVVA